MKKKRNVRIGLVIVVVLLWMFPGCAKREICDFSHPHQGVSFFSFNWDQLFSGADIPRRVMLCFYSQTRDTVICYVSERGKDRVTLPADVYKLLLYNEDTPLDLLYLNRLHTAQAAHPLLAAGTVASAESFYTCVVNSVDIEPDAEVHHTFTLQRCSQKLSFLLQVNGLFNPLSCSASLSGLAGSLFLDTREHVPSDVPVTAVFPLDASGSNVSGVLYILGVHTLAKYTANILTLDFIMSDGLLYNVSVDVTEALGNMVNNEIDVSLLVDGDDVSGIKATVTAWKTGGEVTVVIP